MANKQTVIARTEFEFTDDMIRDHIAGGGAFSWEWWYSVEATPTGYSIEAEDPEGNEVLSVKVTFDQIRVTMGTILEGGFMTTGHGHTWGPTLAKSQLQEGIDSGDFDIDADGGDQIMQCVVFGSVVYC